MGDIIDKLFSVPEARDVRTFSIDNGFLNAYDIGVHRLWGFLQANPNTAVEKYTREMRDANLYIVLPIMGAWHAANRRVNERTIAALAPRGEYLNLNFYAPGSNDPGYNAEDLADEVAGHLYPNVSEITLDSSRPVDQYSRRDVSLLNQILRDSTFANLESVVVRSSLATIEPVIIERGSVKWRIVPTSPIDRVITVVVDVRVRRFTLIVDARELHPHADIIIKHRYESQGENQMHANISFKRRSQMQVLRVPPSFISPSIGLGGTGIVSTGRQPRTASTIWG